MKTLIKDRFYCVEMNNNVSSRFSFHPMANEIKSLSNEQLINRKKYVKMAINFWTENKEQAKQNKVDYNLNYFTTELTLINKRLKS